MPPGAGMLLVKIGRAAERWFTEELKPTGLTPKHVGVLFQVDACPTSQQALIDSIGVDPSKLVGILNDLEEEGLIVRRRDPDDRRRHIVELSKEGRSRLGAAETSARAQSKSGSSWVSTPSSRSSFTACSPRSRTRAACSKAASICSSFRTDRGRNGLVNFRQRRGVEQSGSSPGS